MKTAYMLAAALLSAPAVTMAQENGIQGQWTLSVGGGAALPAGGEFHEGGVGTVLGLPTRVDSKTNRDVFDPAVGWRAGVGYGVSSNVELFGDFAWNRASAKELSVGDVATLDLRAAFGDYTSYGIDAGMRYHFAPTGRVNPYAAVIGGVRRVDAISGTFSVPAAGVTLRDTPFFDKSVVPVFGGDAGVLFGVSERISVGFEGGVRYHTDLNDIEGLAGTGLENLNDAGRGWSVPMTGVLRIAF